MCRMCMLDLLQEHATPGMLRMTRSVAKSVGVPEEGCQRCPRLPALHWAGVQDLQAGARPPRTSVQHLHRSGLRKEQPSQAALLVIVHSCPPTNA